MSTSVFDKPLDQWEYHDVDDFLRSRVAENDRIEYKANFAEHLVDTMVSMCNGDGGYIFVGVSEVPSLKIPKDWPLLDAGKDHAATVYNIAGAETSPNVRPQARLLPHPAAGKQVLVVKIDRGLNPPYFAKNRGVKVRVGDTDVHADPRSLELLFARRSDSMAAREQHVARFRQLIGQNRGFTPPPVILRMFCAPLGTRLSISFGEQSTNELRQAVRDILPNLDTEEERSAVGVRFGRNVQQQLSVLRNGELVYLHVLPEHRPSPDVATPIDISRLFRNVWALLRLAGSVYPKLANYDGVLYTAVTLEGIAEREVDWPTIGPGTPHRRRHPEPFDLWTYDELVFAPGDDGFKATRQILNSLCWQMRYEGHEAYLDRLGRALPGQDT